MGTGRKLRFRKMWEAYGIGLYDMDTGSFQPMLTKLPQVASFADTHLLFYYDHGAGATYYEEGEMARAKASGLKDFLNTTYQARYFAGVEKAISNIQTWIGAGERRGLEVTTEDLYDHIRRGTELIVTIFAHYMACQPQCIAGIEEKAHAMLTEVVSEKNVTELFTVLTTPTLLSTIRKEEIDWLTLLLNISAKRTTRITTEIEGHLRAHYRNYHTLRKGDGNTAETFDDFCKKFRKDRKRSQAVLEKKLATAVNAVHAIKHEQRRLVQQYGISKAILRVCSLLGHIGHWRLEMRARGWTPAYEHISKCFAEVERRLAYPPRTFDFARVKEIYGLFDGTPFKLKTIETRRENFLAAVIDRVMHVYTGDQAEKKFKEFVNVVDVSGIKEFKGNIAMKGRVRGTAVIFRWGDRVEDKIKSMGSDAVLVAGQTRPQLMPLIAKSKAIVTDEGGITSHAAIVSRELGIPCIIGTKIGTQVLKDGDLVEVDAYQGIVTILR